MKFIKLAFLSLSFFIFFSCNKAEKSMNQNPEKPLKSVDEAQNYIKVNFSDNEEVLMISESLNDNMGMNMAIILDGILQAGYSPDGYEQKDGYCIYKYK